MDTGVRQAGQLTGHAERRVTSRARIDGDENALEHRSSYLF
jgi:hypothetical protein